MNRQEQGTIPDEFICVDPDVREQYFDGYLDGTLSEAEGQEFEDHLLLCFKCQEDVEYWQWVIRNIRAYDKRHRAKGKGQEAEEGWEPLPISSIYDRNNLDLTDYYYEKPLMDRLAASTRGLDRLAYPITIEYVKGQVVGQFWKRSGYLFFRLKKSMIGQKPVVCELKYIPSTDLSSVRTFEFHEGQEKRLGAFQEFVSSDTIQEMMEAIKRFRLVMKHQQ